MLEIHNRNATQTGNKIVTYQQWLVTRRELLQAEKALTKLSDDLARRRRQLPWVRIEKPYQFDTADGIKDFIDLFQGRSQPLIYHFMFGPEYESGCASCSAIADGFNGIYNHLAGHDVMLWAVSRAPLAKLLAFQRRMEWTFPWASSDVSDFNFDFGVSFTEEQQDAGIEYNYQLEPVMSHSSQTTAEPGSGVTPDGPAKVAAMTGTDPATYTRERPGMSAFMLQEGAIYHTYSAYARGLDALWAAYSWLDRAPKGRNENGYWWRRHDEYDDKPSPTDVAKDCCH